MKKFVLLLLFVGTITQYCFGRLTVEVGVKYRKSDYTYSEYYFRNIDLYTGIELNRSTKTQDYDSNSDYALIWFSQRKGQSQANRQEKNERRIEPLSPLNY